MSLDWQLHRMPWAQLCEKAVELGYLSHRTATCGLHVHISRSAFGLDEAAQDSAIAQGALFLREALGRAAQVQPPHTPPAGAVGRPLRIQGAARELLDYAKKGYHGGRYTCVNLQNRDTVEFRMFRGTLKPSTILATLELLDRNL